MSFHSQYCISAPLYACKVFKIIWGMSTKTVKIIHLMYTAKILCLILCPCRVLMPSASVDIHLLNNKH